MQTFVDFFTNVAGDWGLWIVFAIVFLETSAMIGLLVPGETTVLLAGALASQGVFDIGDLLAVVCVGAILGDTGGYLLGRKLGREFLLTHGRRFFIKPHHVARAEGFFHRHGGKTVLFGRWVGFLRSLAPFIAGSARMHYGRFVAYDAVGAVSWGTVVVLLGYALGSSYHLAERWLGRVSLFLLIFVITGFLLLFLGRWLWARKEGLGRLVAGFADEVLDWRVSRMLSRRFGRQISWILLRFSPRETYGLMLTVGLVVSAVLAVVFGAILEDVVSRDPITTLDRLVAETLSANAIPWLTQVFVVITTFGSGWVLVPSAALLTAVLFRRGRWRDGLVLLSATSGAAVLNAVLKLLIHRPRPDFLEPLAYAGGYSFPSGHSASAAAFYMTLGLLAAGWVRRWETRVYVLLASVFAVVLIGFSRLYLGVHYLSDVLAGYALGAFWATTAITTAVVLERALSPHPSDKETQSMSADEHTDGGHAGGGQADGGHADHGHAGSKIFSHQRAAVLDDESRLLHLSEGDLRRLLSLDGSEDVADLGSGSGFYTNRVAAWTSGRVYAVELQSEMQDIHKRNGVPANVETVLASADELPLKAESIDRAMSINAFHEAHAPEGIRRLAEALRDDGLFVIVDWRRSPDAAEHGPPLKNRLSVDEVREALDPWFEVVSEEVVSSPFFAVVARKK